MILFELPLDCFVAFIHSKDIRAHYIYNAESSCRSEEEKKITNEYTDQQPEVLNTHRHFQLQNDILYHLEVTPPDTEDGGGTLFPRDVFSINFNGR